MSKKAPTDNKQLTHNFYAWLAARMPSQQLALLTLFGMSVSLLDALKAGRMVVVRRDETGNVSVEAR